jgi:hypothetical protein
MATPSITARSEPAVVHPDAIAPPIARARKMNPRLKAVVLVVVSSCLQLVFRQYASNLLGNELGSISRVEKAPWEPFAHLAYQVALLSFGWYLSYDVIDISALTLLANAPFTYLIVTYYKISPITAAISLGIQILSIALPTYLLRPFAPYHSKGAPVPNRFLLNSFQVQASTALLAIVTYVVPLWAALRSTLSPFLVYHFDIPTVEIAHFETVLTLALKTLLVGWAAQGFLLNSSLGVQTGYEKPVRAFDPVTSSLPETIKQNVWFGSRRTKELIKRTAVVAVLTFVHTVRKISTVQGTDLPGAAGYAALWVAATVLCSVTFAWVGDA